MTETGRRVLEEERREALLEVLRDAMQTFQDRTYLDESNHRYHCGGSEAYRLVDYVTPELERRGLVIDREEAVSAAFKGLRERVAEQVPPCRLREQSAARNDWGICDVHGEVLWDGRCEDYDLGVRDALTAAIDEALEAAQ